MGTPGLLRPADSEAEDSEASDPQLKFRELEPRIVRLLGY